MSSSINIYPFRNEEELVVFGVQILIFLIGLLIARHLIIKPAIRLYQERYRRTVGSTEHAQKDQEHARDLEHSYYENLKKGADEAHKMRHELIHEAETQAQKILQDAQEKTERYIRSANSLIESELRAARPHLVEKSKEIKQMIRQKVGVTSAFIFIFTTSLLFSNQDVFAASTPHTESLVASFWYSIFWPYFQFIFFLGAMYFIAKKPIKSLLGKKRDELRTKLSEAHAAKILAERKVKEYESKIASLKSEIEELKKQNVFDAKLESERILLDAQRTAASMLSDAERATTELIFQTKQEIKHEIYKLALEDFKKDLTPETLNHLNASFKNEMLSKTKSFN
jgi:F0F1-type ATP synthase membrane subunit b/b'